MNKVKLLFLGISPFIIGQLFSYFILKLDWVGMELSIISILFCIYWFFVGYRSYDYGKSARESILLGNSFAIVSIILIVFQVGIMGRYMTNIIGHIPQTFYLPMVRISSLIMDILYLFVRFTTNSMFYHIISFILMMIIYCSGYNVAKTFNEGMSTKHKSSI